MSLFTCVLSLLVVLAPPPTSKEPGAEIAAVNGVSAEVTFKNKLIQLTPGDAKGYFELGEEVAAQAVDHGDVLLAKRLFVLAYEFDRSARAPTGVAASSCIALASLPPLVKDRAWLMSIATLIDPRYAVSSETLAEEAKVAPALGYQAATALGMVRAGEGFAARNLLEQPDVQQILKRYERLLSANGALGALSKLKSEAARWPCQTCGGARFTKSPGSTDARKCPVCDALPGWRLSEADFESQVSLEAKLLAGIQSSWAAQVLSDDEAPLRDSDPASVPAALGVDVRRTVYRDGAWVEPKAAAAEKGKPMGDTVAPK